MKRQLQHAVVGAIALLKSDVGSTRQGVGLVTTCAGYELTNALAGALAPKCTKLTLALCSRQRLRPGPSGGRRIS